MTSNQAVLDADGALPETWYDADYFNGITSNYREGYTWERLGTLFMLTAQWLCDLFPTVQSYLDIGCAKGYQVRALRDCGKEAWGVDHSTYCLTEACDPVAHPYLRQQRLEELSPVPVDLVLAFEVLEHLTVAQIDATLPRVRQCARQGLLATIPTPDMPHKRAWQEAQQEPSHLTLQPRAWWVERFQTAGWVHTPFHGLAERFCMAHPLPRTTGWNVFLFGSARG